MGRQAVEGDRALRRERQQLLVELVRARGRRGVARPPPRRPCSPRRRCRGRRRRPPPRADRRCRARPGPARARSPAASRPGPRPRRCARGSPASGRRCCRRRRRRPTSPSSSPKRSRSVSRSASAWHGWCSGVSPLTTGTAAPPASSATVSCEPDADHDRVQVAREHPRGVGERLAAAELELVGAQRQRVRRRAPRRPTWNETRVRVDGRLEEQGHRLARERVAADPLARGRAFSSAARSSSAVELVGGELLAGEEMSRRPRSSRAFYVARWQLRALTWNLFHGRDSPARPGAADLALAAAADHRAQRHPRPGQPRPVRRVRRRCSRAADWDVALLQECPPRWAAPLAAATRRRGPRACSPRATRSAPLRSLLARLNPDLIASNEGGSNLTLVRGARIPSAASSSSRPGPPRAPGDGVHPRAPRPDGRRLRRQPARQRRAAAARATPSASCSWRPSAPCEWAGDDAAAVRRRPQPAPARDATSSTSSPTRYGLRAPTGRDSLDHLLARGLEVAEPPAAWPPERREVDEGELAIRLSDHAPVAGNVRARQIRCPGSAEVR